MSWDRDAVIMVARTVDIHALVKQCAAGELDFGTLCERVHKMGFKTTALFEMVRQQEAFMAKQPDIEIVEPTEQERRNILNTARPLTPVQQDVILTIESAIRIVGELHASDASSDKNPVYRHPYHRAAVRALELAHSELLNWFDRDNRGFYADVSWVLKPDEPEKQE